MHATQFDLGWLVGLIEGDGCFTSDGKYPVVALKITDLDVAQRFARMFATTVHGPYHDPDHQLGTKPYYVSKVTGKRARDFMASTAHHFSERRREQIDNLIGKQLSIDAVTMHSSNDEECSARQGE